MFITVLIFIAVLAVLVLVHEFGHFIVAKRSGMRVEEFGFGFPPRLFGIQKINGKFRFIFGHPKEVSTDSTVYSFNAIPLGGFVKIYGENNDASEVDGSFTSKSFGRRFLTLTAGIIMNIVLAWFLISIGYMQGLPVGISDSSEVPKHAKISDEHVQILELEPNSPAETAGIKPNDVITGVDGKQFRFSSDLHAYITEHRGQTFAFQVRRGSETQTINVASIADPEPNKGSVGVTMVTVAKLAFPFHIALVEGLKTTFIQLFNIVHGLWKLITAGVGLGSLGGPVKIAQLTGEVAGMGFTYLLQFTAFLSLNLAVLNSLPFPALDGGRVLFLVIEKIRGKKNNQLVEQYANTIGFALLLLLMVIVTIKDLGSISFIQNIL